MDTIEPPTEIDALGEEWTRLASALGRELEAPSFEALVDAIRPRTVIPPAPRILTALRNAELRRGFLAAVGAFTSAQVSQLAASRARNPHALANRWRKEGRIFAVTWNDQSLYPSFQFTSDGAPRQAIASVLAAFRGGISPWEMAIWFVTPSPHLPGRARPIDWLEDPSALAEAAGADSTAPQF